MKFWPKAALSSIFTLMLTGCMSDETKNSYQQEGQKAFAAAGFTVKQFTDCGYDIGGCLADVEDKSGAEFQAHFAPGTGIHVEKWTGFDDGVIKSGSFFYKTYIGEKLDSGAGKAAFEKAGFAVKEEQGCAAIDGGCLYTIVDQAGAVFEGHFAPESGLHVYGWKGFEAAKNPAAQTGSFVYK